MMNIPTSTENPCWYVAISLKEAYSSWGSLLEARASIARYEENDPDRQRIRGIVENGPLGPRFVEVTRFPVNKHDKWVGLDTECPLLRSEIVLMARAQLVARDRLLKDMDLIPDWVQEHRIAILDSQADQVEKAEQVLEEWDMFFPETLDN